MNGPNDRDLLPVEKVEPIRERISRVMDKLRKIPISRNSIYGFLLLSGIIVVLLLLTKPFQEQGLDYLTEAERAWLGENSEKIEVLFGGEAPSEAYHDENGKYVGFLVDFLHEIERHLGVSFKVRKFSTWEELMAYSRSQRDFIIVGIAQTEERRRYLSFTNPLVKIPYVIITKRANANVALTDLEQANVCTVKGYAVNDYIHQFFPQITPRPVIDDLQGLRSVATGDCDAFVADQAIATFLIEQQGLANLKISGESGYLNRLGIAVSIHDVVLHEILDKTVDRISPNRQREIYSQWVSIGAVLSNSMRAGLAFGAITVIGIVAILWLWSISLRATVRKQTAQIRHDLNKIQATEEALREKSEELEKFFSNSLDLLAIADTDGHFRRLNREWEKALGYPLDELEGRRFLDFVHPEDMAATLAAIGDLDAQQAVLNFTNRYRHRDGAYRWIEWRSIPAGKYVYAAARDVTEHKRAEAALQESEDTFRKLFEGSSDPILLLQGDRFVECNQAALRLLGATDKDRFIGSTPLDISPERQPDGRLSAIAAPEYIARAHREGNCRFEWLCQRYDGTPFLLDVSLMPIALRGESLLHITWRDITERKRAETALRESEARLRAAIESAPFDFFLIGADGRYALQNSASKKNWGDIVGQSPAEVTDDPEMLAHWNGNNRRAFAGEIVEEEVRFTVGDEERYIYNVIAPVKDRDAIIGIVGLNIDITDRKRAEAELERHREHLEELVAERTAELRQAMNQLVQVEKLAALGNLVAGMAHELNTPLGNARMVASSLGEALGEFAAAVESGALRRSQLDAFLTRGREAVELLERNAARAADLIAHFKQVAVDQTSMRRRRFLLRQTVEELLATLQPQFKRTAHRVELDIPTDLELDSYPGPLEQVLANLVTNSLAHGFAGIEAGVIRIHAAPLDADRIQLDYTDDGAGIPESILKRIFEPFFTTKLGSGGSGLGLYIVYNLVTGVLGGTIQGSNNVGKGVRFAVILPRIIPDQDPTDYPQFPTDF